MLQLWTMVAAGLALWVSEARTWESLRFVIPHGWRMWVAIGLVLAVSAAHTRTIMKIARLKRSKRVKMGHAEVEALVPRTGDELGWWVGLSLSAGFCEEFVFRGYLVWVFQPFLGVWGAGALSV